MAEERVALTAYEMVVLKEMKMAAMSVHQMVVELVGHWELQ